MPKKEIKPLFGEKDKVPKAKKDPIVNKPVKETLIVEKDLLLPTIINDVISTSSRARERAPPKND